MPHTFTRLQLYDLVWSEPMRNVAAKYNISDRGLAKACAAANIPVPERGYWNKLQANKKTLTRVLPPRGIGQSDNVIIGGPRWGYYNSPKIDHLNEPIPPPPVFEIELDMVRSQVTTTVNKAPLPKSLVSPHHLIAKLVGADEARLQKKLASPYPSPWDGPIFDTDFERRRLKILNGLFTCLQYCGMKPSIQDHQARNLSVTVGDQRVSFSLDSTQAEKQLERENAGWRFVARGNKDKLRLTITNWRLQGGAQSWQDKDGDRLEDHLRAIAIELIVAGEASYRQGRIDHHAWLIERKADAEKEEIQQKKEAERKRREREEKLAKRRIDHLLNQAGAFHQAAQIRAYVATVGSINESAPQPMPAEELVSWTEWALAQADRIDPVISGAFRNRPSELEE